MSSVVLSEARGIQDLLDTSNYRFEIGSIPGGSNDSNLAIQCTSAVYPGVTNETFAQIFPGGHELTFRGRKVFPKTLSITYVESVVMNVTQEFGNWFEFLSGTDTGNASGYKTDYAIDGAQLTIFDLTGASPDVVTFYGLQPTTRPDITVDSSGTNVWSISIDFAYDFYYSSLFGPSSGTTSGSNPSTGTNSSVASGVSTAVGNGS